MNKRHLKYVVPQKKNAKNIKKVTDNSDFLYMHDIGSLWRGKAKV